MGVQTADIFTTELTNSSLTITEDMGVTAISIYNSTAVVGTVRGSRKLGSNSSSNINVTEKMTYTISTKDAAVIKSLVITAPSGCTLKITAE